MHYLVQTKCIYLHLQLQTRSHSFLQFLQLESLVATSHLNKAISPGRGQDAGQRAGPGEVLAGSQVMWLFIGFKAGYEGCWTAEGLGCLGLSLAGQGHPPWWLGRIRIRGCGPQPPGAWTFQGTWPRALVLCLL